MSSDGGARSADEQPVAASAGLVGRARELAVLTEMVHRLDDGTGAALVIRGEAGIGKSSLVEAVAAEAVGRGILVLSATGVQSEARITYAALHLILRPIWHLAEGLHPRQNTALLAAFGLLQETAPEAFPVGLAALELIGDAAETSPILIIVDDAHWLDAPSAAALTFVARRLGSEQAAMLVAVRDGHPSPFDDGGLPELRLAALDEDAAEALLEAAAQGLSPMLRERILTAAEGNPLALTELPVTLRSHRLNIGTQPDRLPLSTRLEQAFAARLSGLPVATVTLMLAASAADDEVVSGEVLAAASLMAGTLLTADDFAPAIAAGLVEIEAEKLRFRHPLVRSAVYQSAPWARRQAVHAALAQVLVAQPDRQVWHQAAGATRPGDQVAAALEAAATRAEQRGAVTTAIGAMRRAAELSTTREDRGARFVRATNIAFTAGYPALAEHLLMDAESLDLPAVQQLWLSWMRESHSESNWSGAAKVRSFVEMADQMIASGQGRLAMEPLMTIALRCWWGNPTEETRAAVVSVADRMPLSADDLNLLFVFASADPVQRGAHVLDRISRMSAQSADLMDLQLAGLAAATVWDYELTLRFIDPAVAGLRAQGRLARLAESLVTQAWAAAHLAREHVAISAADEAYRLSMETRQPRWAIAAQLVKALIAAERGDRETAEALAREAETVFLSMGATPMVSLVQFVRGRGAVTGQRYEEAFEHLRRAMDPGDPVFLPFVGLWGMADLIEAAAQTGRADSASAHLARLESLAEQTTSPYLRAQAAYGRPLLAADDQAEALYRDALDRELASWPSFRARMQLWYGRWLRRQRRVAESRAPLRAARDAFDALGFADQAETARQELRASGETSRSRMPDAWDQLTPQELQIARMAAQGMANREIGQQLFLSHRTVGYHLHRIFTKLGITSRGQLHTAVSREA